MPKAQCPRPKAQRKPNVLAHGHQISRGEAQGAFRGGGLAFQRGTGEMLAWLAPTGSAE
ncbi:MAG: hypothetical protein JWR69_1538 [Pedosphaera sp.]|nr:hypothetical protein [Pedosphaera sp.]